jgi:PAS domain S-box-containing protein
LEDVYASSASAAERPTGVRRRTASAERSLTPGSTGAAATTSAWPFRGQAYVAALEHVSDAVLIVDRSGTVLYANVAARTLVERTRPEGRHVRELVELDGPVLRNVLRELRDSTLWRGTATVEILGEPRELELTVSAVIVSGWGRAQGFTLSARAVTQQPQALQLRSSARDVLATMMRVAGTIAHDFNNQIAVVLNYSFILLRELSIEQPVRAHVEELQHAAWRAADSARQLLRLGDKPSPDKATLDVNDVIREAHSALSLISRSQTELDPCLSPEPCMAKARQPELEWLLLDLAQRLRTRLGELQRVRIATSHAADGGTRAPRIRIELDAFPANTAVAHGLCSVPCEHETPRLSAQLDCELALQPLPDNGLRYVIELPGA